LSTIGTGLEEREAFAVMDTAVALGITIFDTADGYAGGRSEEIIGAWLVRGGAATVSTKVGVAGGTRHGRNLAPERILEHAETSRRRLGLPTLPMYMVHAPDPERPVADSLRAFDQLHRDGVIQSLGICNVDVTILEEWLDTADRLGAIPVSWVQNEYSLIVRRDETAVLGFCQDHGLAYTAYSPLCGGILAGRYRRGEPPPVNSRIAVLKDQYGPRLTDDVYAGLDALADFAGARGVSMAAVALAWLMTAPTVVTPLVAPRTPDQFDSVVQAAGLALSADERRELSGLFPG
jgi:aryl-alcohol dehydrogenase-like predicted oxidoreductase